MPDIQAGDGCTIGTTMTIKDKIVPNLVSVNINCGMETLMIHNTSETARNLDPKKLDKCIRKLFLVDLISVSFHTNVLK